MKKTDKAILITLSVISGYFIAGVLIGLQDRLWL